MPVADMTICDTDADHPEEKPNCGFIGPRNRCLEDITGQYSKKNNQGNKYRKHQRKQMGEITKQLIASMDMWML